MEQQPRYTPRHFLSNNYQKLRDMGCNICDNMIEFVKTKHFVFQVERKERATI